MHLISTPVFPVFHDTMPIPSTCSRDARRTAGPAMGFREKPPSWRASAANIPPRLGALALATVTRRKMCQQEPLGKLIIAPSLAGATNAAIPVKEPHRFRRSKPKVNN